MCVGISAMHSRGWVRILMREEDGRVYKMMVDGGASYTHSRVRELHIHISIREERRGGSKRVAEKASRGVYQLQKRS